MKTLRNLFALALVMLCAVNVSAGKKVLLSANFDDGSVVFNGWGNNQTRDVVDGAFHVNNPSAVNSWESQIAYDFNDPFLPNNEYTLTMKIRGSAAGQITFGLQNADDGYISVGEFGTIDFDVDWVNVRVKCLCNGEGGRRFIASIGQFEGDIYIDDFELAVYTESEEVETGANIDLRWVNVLTNSDLEGEEMISFIKTENNPDVEDPLERIINAPITDGIGKDGSRGIKVSSFAGAAQDWDAQFFIALPYALPEGTKYRVKYDARASVETTLVTQAHSIPGNYLHYNMIGTPTLTTDWQSFEATGTLSASQAGNGTFQSVCFLLAINKEENVDFYFDNLTFEILDNGLLPQYSADIILMDLARPTNIPALVAAGGKKRLILPEGTVAVTINGETIDVYSAEIYADGRFYAFIDAEFCDDDDVQVTFTNSADPAYQIIYTDDNTVVPDYHGKGYYNERVSEVDGAIPCEFAAPEVMTINPGANAFNLPVSFNTINITFDKAVCCDDLRGYLGNERLAVVPATGYAEQVKLTRTSTEDLAEGEYEVLIEDIHSEVGAELDKNFWGSVRYTINIDQDKEDDNLVNAGKKILLSTDFEDGRVVFFGWGNDQTCDVVDGAFHVNNPLAVNSWESQFAYDFGEAFLPDAEYTITMRIRGSGAGQIYAMLQIPEGNYASVGDFEAIDFDENWKEVRIKCICNGEGGRRLIFSIGTFEGDIYIEDFEFSVYQEEDNDEVPNLNWTNILTNSDLEGEDNESFKIRENDLGKVDSLGNFVISNAEITDGIGKDGSRGIKITSFAGASDDWDAQFYIVLPEPLSEGTEYRVKFDYRASKEVAVVAQAHSAPTHYIFYDIIGSYIPAFSTEWQTYEYTGKLSAIQAGDGTFQTIAFDLAINKEEDVDFYFDNLTFEICDNKEDNDTNQEPFSWANTFKVRANDVSVFKEISGYTYPSEFGMEITYNADYDLYLVTKFLGEDITALNYGGISLKLSDENPNKAEIATTAAYLKTIVAGESYLTLKDMNLSTSPITLTHNGDGTISISDFCVSYMTYDVNWNQVHELAALYTGVTTFEDGNIEDKPVVSSDMFVVSDASVFTGSSFTFPVSMTNENSITAFQCDVYLSDGLALNFNEEWDYDVVLSAARKTSSHSVAVSQQPDGAYRVVVYSSGNKLFRGNEGELFTLNLTAWEGYAENQTVEIRNIRLSTSDQQEYLLNNVKASVTVKSYTPADANGDGQVTIVDVVAVVNALMGITSDNFVFDAADMDQNGEITIVDVVAVVNVLMGKNVQSYGARSIFRSDIHVADAEVKAGETTTLYVELDNAQAYTALQMDVELPEGLNIEGVEMVGNSSHAVTCNEDGRIAAYSLNNSRFNGGKSLMGITVKADEGFAGTARVDFTNVRVVSMDVVETTLADAYSTVIGGATDIDDVLSDESVQVIYYTTDGIASDVPHKGLNIIKRIYGDGRVEVNKEMFE